MRKEKKCVTFGRHVELNISTLYVHTGLWVLDVWILTIIACPMKLIVFQARWDDGGETDTNLYFFGLFVAFVSFFWLTVCYSKKADYLIDDADFVFLKFI